MEEEKFLDWDDDCLIEFVEEIKKDYPNQIDIFKAIITYRYYSKEVEDDIEEEEIFSTLNEIGVIDNLVLYRHNIYNYYIVKNLYGEDEIKRDTGGNVAKYKIKPMCRKQLKQKYLNDKYLKFLKNKPLPKIKDEESLIQLTEDNLKLNPKKGLPSTLIPQLIEEVNLNYYYRQYNSCALICRRICEILIIEALEIYNNTQDDSNKITIENEQGYLGLGNLIGKFKNCKFKGVDKHIKDCLDYVKKYGDIGAHHKFISVEKKNIEEIKPDIDNTIKTLLQLGEFYKLDNN
jgi:hypothetical protein